MFAESKITQRKLVKNDDLRTCKLDNFNPMRLELQRLSNFEVLLTCLGIRIQHKSCWIVTDRLGGNIATSQSVNFQPTRNGIVKLLRHNIVCLHQQ